MHHAYGVSESGVVTRFEDVISSMCVAVSRKEEKKGEKKGEERRGEESICIEVRSVTG